MKRTCLTLPFMGLALMLSSRAAAEAPVQARKMGIESSATGLSLFYSARDLIDADAQKKLDSGLPQRIVVQHFVYARGKAEPIAISGHSCRVVYDLWQTVYRVEYELFGVGVNAFAYRTRAEVIDRCLVMRGFPLGQVPAVADAPSVYVASLIELNPLSNTTLARIRRWLARPRGDYNVEGKSFFGSFVSLFVNDRIGAAERVLRLRSQDVELRSWP